MQQNIKSMIFHTTGSGPVLLEYDICRIPESESWVLGEDNSFDKVVIEVVCIDLT